VQEPLEPVDDLVLAQRQLLGLAVGVLNHVDELSEDDLAVLLDELQEAEGAKLLAVRARGGDRDQREVELVGR
jgi:hypothetical protein